MPARNMIRTYTGGPQGEDAKVVIKMPTIGEMRHQQKDMSKFEDGSDESEASARSYFSEHVVEWNWVDGDGQPLPSPRMNPDAFTELLADELSYLGKCLSGEAPQFKAEIKK